ncbi:Hypothetical predicted protein, partial [Paramuricea clavata]
MLQFTASVQTTIHPEVLTRQIPSKFQVVSSPIYISAGLSPFPSRTQAPTTSHVTFRSVVVQPDPGPIGLKGRKGSPGPPGHPGMWGPPGLRGIP